MNKYFLIVTVVLISVLILGTGIYLYSTGGQKAKTLGAKSQITHLNPSEFKKALETNEYELLDIRTADEYRSGHIPGAKQIDFYQTQNFSNFLDSLDKNKKYLIYCRSGNRSSQALNIMEGKEFSNVSDLAGGFNSWSSSGYPAEH